jgi:hypothetical protein
MGQELANEFGVPFVETSAKNNEGKEVGRAFNLLTKMVVNDVLMAEKEEEEDEGKRGGRGGGGGRGRGGRNSRTTTVDVGNGRKSNWFGCC